MMSDAYALILLVVLEASPLALLILKISDLNKTLTVNFMRFKHKWNLQPVEEECVVTFLSD